MRLLHSVGNDSISFDIDKEERGQVPFSAEGRIELRKIMIKR